MEPAVPGEALPGAGAGRVTDFYCGLMPLVAIRDW